MKIDIHWVYSHDRQENVAAVVYRLVSNPVSRLYVVRVLHDGDAMEFDPAGYASMPDDERRDVILEMLQILRRETRHTRRVAKASFSPPSQIASDVRSPDALPD